MIVKVCCATVRWRPVLSGRGYLSCEIVSRDGQEIGHVQSDAALADRARLVRLLVLGWNQRVRRDALDGYPRPYEALLEVKA
jgi:hypothetical protein